MATSLLDALYRRAIRPSLFAFPSEWIHNHTLWALEQAALSPAALAGLRRLFQIPELPVEPFGLRFPNPVGLAAGMDKFARATPLWEALGFGFCELGGVTAWPQPGNPQPRMFRAIAERALVNRMGFNNPGSEAMATALKAWKDWNLWPSSPVGINLGKSKRTPVESAPWDYAQSLERLHAAGDFFVVNVSSPNTPGLRSLQDAEALSAILRALDAVAAQRAHPKPILIKIAPDLEALDLEAILDVAQSHGIAGLVATNTTVARPETRDARSRATFDQTGGLSGRPLRARSLEWVRAAYEKTEGRLPIIGVGGIFSARDAWESLAAGASLVQLYTALVYEGPGAPSRIVRELASALDRAQMASVAELTGSGAPTASSCTSPNKGNLPLALTLCRRSRFSARTP